MNLIDQHRSALAVIGMHRSGTSMVTGMIAMCDVAVGPSSELLGPSKANPTGHWERRPMLQINEVALERLGLAWDHVPALPAPGWEHDARFDDLVDAGRAVIDTFPEGRPFAWKDPRTSITLPLWERVMDGAPASAILCVRNPLDVWRSLEARGAMSMRLSLQLWQAYSESALSLARARTHVLTHYDAYFEDAVAELTRICDAVAIEVSAEALKAATGVAQDAHRHAVSGLDDLVRSGASDAVVALYLELLLESGPVMDLVAQRDPLVLAADGEAFNRAETLEWVAEFRDEQGIERDRVDALAGTNVATN